MSWYHVDMGKIEGKRKNIYYQAQAILARRDHAEAEVRVKLARKRFAPDEIDRVISRLYTDHLLNDDRFAYSYAESILLAKPVGRRFIAAKLKQKGAKRESIEKALDQIYSEHPENELVQEAVARWQRAHMNVKSGREKLYRFLASRGFSLDAISGALGDV